MNVKKAMSMDELKLSNSEYPFNDDDNTQNIIFEPQTSPSQSSSMSPPIIKVTQEFS